MRNILLAILLCSSLLTFAQKDYTTFYDSDSIINTGVRLYDAGKYVEAIAEYEKIRKTDPEFLRAQYEKAMALSAGEDKDPVETFLKNLHKKGDMQKFPSLFTLYGNCLSDQKKFEEAETIFIEGRTFLPNSSNFLFNMAILYVRKEEPQKAVDLLKKVVTINPNMASAHYFLGTIALDNGKITEGTVAFLSYLIIAPEGRYANDIILKLNKKFSQNYLEKNKLVFSETEDNFAEIETILRNQLPLKSAYKVQSSIDDVIIRQVQAVMEYTTTHKIENGFFETTYFPWIADLINKKQFEGFSYYMLLSLEESLGKKLTSQKKKITAFYIDYVMKDFWNLFAKRKMEHFGTQQEVLITLGDNYPLFCGTQMNGQYEGKCKKFDDNGNTIAELNFKNGLLEGLQKYFGDNGNLVAEVNYTADKREGQRKTYYSNGNPEVVENYKNDLLDGNSITYYVNGGKQCEFNYKDDKREGMLSCYYPNGFKKSQLAYKDGKANGQYLFYNESGDIIYNSNYINDQLDGDYLEYYDGKIVKTDAKYSNGKPVGTIKTYYPNKAEENVITYNNGKIAKYVSHYANGKMSSETLYNDKEEIETYTYYDWNGNKYFEEKYKSGELKNGFQYLNGKSEPETISVNKKPFVIRSFNNTVQVSGDFEKGKKIGNWQYFYSNENLRIKESYIKDAQNGIREDYNKNGTLRSICNYENNVIKGVYDTFDNGILSQSVFYSEGDQNGPYESYYADGKLVSEGFLESDKVNYDQYSYWQNGNLIRITHYIKGELSSSDRFNNDGTKEGNFDYKNKTGSFTSNYYGGITTSVIEFVNGWKTGKYLYHNKLKKPLVESEFVNNKQTKVYKSYGPADQIQFEGTYYNGKLHGITKRFDHAGNERLTEEYAFGDEYGFTQRFYHNKKKMLEYNRFDGNIDGEFKYYNQSGDLILSLFYENNVLKYYLKKNPSGAVSEKIMVANETAQVASLYPNGKTAISMNFVKGNLEGKLAIFGLEGNPEYEVDYAKNLYNGLRTEYYPNGKVYKKETFKNGDYEGIQHYFREDGKPHLTANYKNDELHGDFLIYTNGILTTTKKYDSDELLEISK